jgi:hypothetical protein
MGREMKRSAIIVLVIILFTLSPLSANETSEKQEPGPRLTLYSFFIESFSLVPPGQKKKSPAFSLQTKNLGINLLQSNNYPFQIKTLASGFRLDNHESSQFDFRLPFYMHPHREVKKSYSGALLDISGINLAVWSLDSFILKKSWAQISLKSIYNNLDHGFEWDGGIFISNHLTHLYHGALYYSAARLNGLDIAESTLFASAGSLMWELFFESNYPSINDVIMTTLGGFILGGPFYQMAGSLYSQNSRGLGGLFQKSLMLIINPSFSFSLFSGDRSGLNFFTEKHYYSFQFPLGTYWSTTNKQKYLFGICVENKDYREKELGYIKPYEWFLIDGRMGFCKDDYRDKEISATVLLSGKKTKTGLRGLVGVYDYIDTEIIERISTTGIGMGAVSSYYSDPNFFTEASGVLSFVLGGSSPSLDVEKCQFGEKDQKPYYFGPGLMSRFRIEVGRKGMGSILAKFSQYWINSLFSDAQESLSVSSFNIRLAVTKNAKINLGYDCYIRQGTILKENHAATKGAFKIFLIQEF